MDNLTHSLFGALIGQAGLKRKTGLGMPALIIGANIPDIDATCTIYGIESLAMRRGITHGPPAMILLPLLLAAGLWWYDRWQTKRGKRPDGRLPVRFGWLYLLSLIGCLSHPALDWMNSYGVRLLEPFSSRWFYGDVLFIIDIWLWLGLGFATWLSLRREKRGGEWRKPARIALAGALAYIGVNLALTHLVLAVGFTDQRPKFVVLSPVPVAFWDRELIYGFVNDGRVEVFAGDAWSRRHPPVSSRFCRWPDTDKLVKSRPDLDAFLFWARAPFVTPADDGKGIVFNDARFYNGVTRGRFAVEVKGIPCE